MKVFKYIFYTVVGLIMAGCAGILVCVFNPSLTDMLAEQFGRAGIGSYGEVQPGVSEAWVYGRGGNGYEVPGSRPENAAVGGRAGYEPVREEGEQIPQDVADDLSGVILPGDTGSGLTFDETFYPYYAMLNKDMQQLYSQIYANARNLLSSFAPVVPVTVSQLKSVYEAVYNDHPELFWLDGGYSCKYLGNGSCVEITLKYNDTSTYLEDARQDFQMYARRILSGAEGLGSDSEKEQYIHDKLMEMVEYDPNASLNQSAYSALVHGWSVCAGYARAYQFLMQQLGIPCYYCTGYAGEDHAWNIVKINGDYYNVDVTWDDTNPSTQDYFNKSDQEFAPTHVRTGLSVYLPACEKDSGGEQNTDTDGTSSDLSGFINPNPMEPLRWQSNPQPDNGNTGMTAEEKKQANLEAAGLTEDQVRENMEDYYKECLKLLKEVGVGDKKFSVNIPETLWNSVERAYTTGDYWKNYVDDALEELKVENFVIHIQVERLGGGYYRVYHNVLTY